MKNTKPKFEIYHALHSRKTYLVSFGTGYDLFFNALKHYKVKSSRIALKEGWVLNDELYLKDPHDPKAKLCYVAYTRRYSI